MGSELQTAVVGATGYAGFELTKLLFQHPRLKPPLLLSHNGHAGQELPELFPDRADREFATLHPFSWSLLHRRGVDLLFLATPHDVSRAWVPEAVRHGLRIIDLSGAWRLHCPQYRDVYGFTDANPDEATWAMQKAIYGLPELHRKQLPDAQLVANPGCYSTSIILALAPLVHAGLLDVTHGVVCDAKSGVSGAGKQPTPKTHFVETAENFRAYSAFNHRHTGEILEQLSLSPQDVTFTTHLLPIRRGIFANIYVYLNRVCTSEQVEACLRDFYEDCSFVRVFTPPKLPEIQFSLHTNFCDLGMALGPDGRRLMLVSCLDNLLKGAAGQAVQNMNVMYGWKEREGLQ